MQKLYTASLRSLHSSGGSQALKKGIIAYSDKKSMQVGRFCFGVKEEGGRCTTQGCVPGFREEGTPFEPGV